MSTLSIAKAVVGGSGIKKDVNKLLYQLCKAGQIVQTSIEGDTNWHWMLKATENARDTSTSTIHDNIYCIFFRVGQGSSVSHPWAGTTFLHLPISCQFFVNRKVFFCECQWLWLKKATIWEP